MSCRARQTAPYVIVRRGPDPRSALAAGFYVSLVFTDELGTTTITYVDFVGDVFGKLCDVDAGERVTELSSDLWTLLVPSAATRADKAMARKAIIERIKDARTATTSRPTAE